MKKKLYKIIISAILLIIAVFISFQNEWINNGILLVSYLIVGFEILKKAFRNIIRGKVFDENFLMTIATLGALCIGEIHEAVAVMLFYQIGELFQSYAVDKSRKSISSLMNIRPDYANLLKDEKEEKVDPDEVKIGDIILIKPGEKVPLDGVVIEGNSMLDTKALTGESVPKSVKVDDEILSGCINIDGILKIRVTKEFEESTVSKILDLVENASSKKSKSENFITKFAKIYTPIVVIIALFLAFIPPLIIKSVSFSEWIYRALSFLVVSCPCALVISIPLSFFGGIGGASKQGILIKGSNYIEALSKTEAVVFDKTGTLTEGVFEVQKIIANEIAEEKLIEIAAYAESYSNHPIANSIKLAYGKEIDNNKIIDIKEIAGKGIFANIENKNVLIGNESLMNENNIDFKPINDIGTILYIAIERKFVGAILISDKIKKDANKTIRSLKSHGIKETVILTGDKKEVAENVSEKIGIDKVYYELLPDGKVAKFEELLKNKSEKGKIAFAGDGINDAPVLALADVGIAMGGLGSDSAIEAADVVIMTDEPSKIVTAIKLAKKNMRIVKENIVFAITIKILILILTAFGITSMWWAVFADVGVSIIAILNSLRMIVGK